MIKEMIIRPANEIYEEPLIIPISIPDDSQITQLAFNLHRQGQPYTGRMFGWDIYYRPSQRIAPVGSSLSFTPACFIIGESSIWSVSFDWENGDEAPPLITAATHPQPFIAEHAQQAHHNPLQWVFYARPPFQWRG